MFDEAVSEIAAITPQMAHPARQRRIAIPKPLKAAASWLEAFRRSCVQLPEEPELRERFLSELKHQTLERGRTACIIAIALMPAIALVELGSGLSLGPALCANLSILLGARAIMIYLKTAAGQRKPEPSLLFGFLYCGLIIDLMVYGTGGFTSPYYGMLNLLSLTVALLMPWEFRYSLAVFFLPMGAYLSIGDLHRVAGDEQAMTLHLVLLVLTAIIALISDLILRRARLTGFLQQHRLLQAVAYRDALVARVSHELRTPLTVMLGYTEMLQSDIGETHPEHVGTLERIAENADDLSRLIDEMLMLSQLRGGCLGTSNEPVELGDFTRALTAEFAPLFEKHELRLSADLSDARVTTVTDPRLLRQILCNLLSNALKFSREGEVVIRSRIVAGTALNRWQHMMPASRALMAQPEVIEISVIDRGIGIEASALKLLFADFGQLPDESATAEGRSGVGLGLSISMRLARLLGGAIAVYSIPGHGSEFALLLPYRHADTDGPGD